MAVEKIIEPLERIGKALAVIIVVFSLFTYFLTIVLGPPLFFNTSEGLTVAARQIHQLPIDFFMIVTVDIPVGISLGVLFAALWASFVDCFFLAWLSRGGFIASLTRIFEKTASVAKTNFLFIMPLVASALLYATIQIQRFQETQGVQTGSLNFPPQTSQYLILLELAFAPLREEFAFRVTSIGLPLGILLLLLYRKKMGSVAEGLRLLLVAMASPESAKIKVGYKNVTTNGFLRGISLFEWILILGTAFAFGSAHLLLGGGWQIGKVTTAFLAGLVFGIMYVAYGAYASILLHWFFNYYFTVLGLAETAYGGAFRIVAGITELANLGAGVVVVAVFLLVTLLRSTNSLRTLLLGQKNT